MGSKANTKIAETNQLTFGKLPSNLMASIRKSKLSGDDLLQWENSKPAFWLVIENGQIIMQVHACLPMKKGLAILASVGGIAWTVIQNLPALETLARNFKWP